MGRRPTDAAAVRRLARHLGRVIGEPTTLYLVGGATAVLEGWRPTTVDCDVLIEPEHEAILAAIPRLKEELSMNVEFASPLDFLPELPGWRDRSPFVAQEGRLTVRHFDPYSQALAKLERGFATDLADVAAMVERGLVEPARLEQLLAAVEDQFLRFPTVDYGALRDAVRRLDERYQGSPSEAS